MRVANEPNALIEAIKAGDAEAVKTTIGREPDLLKTRDSNGASPLLLAIYHQKHDIVAVLADAAEIDLFEAAALGRVDRIEQLLNAEPTLASAHSPDGFSAVSLAAFFGRLDAVKTFIAAGADLHAPATNGLKVQAIHAAVASRNLEIVRALLEAGANPNAPQQQGFRPMHESGSTGNRELAELLMQYGGDPTLGNDDGKSTIALAREKGHADFADWLEKRP